MNDEVSTSEVASEKHKYPRSRLLPFHRAIRRKRCKVNEKKKMRSLHMCISLPHSNGQQKQNIGILTYLKLTSPPHNPILIHKIIFPRPQPRPSMTRPRRPLLRNTSNNTNSPPIMIIPSNKTPPRLRPTIRPRKTIRQSQRITTSRTIPRFRNRT